MLRTSPTAVDHLARRPLARLAGGGAVELAVRRVSRASFFAPAALLALAACSAEVAPRALRLDVPIAPTDRALVLATRRTSAAGPGSAGAELSLTALPIAADGTIPPLAEPLEPDAALVVTALAYDVPLAELGLTPGPIGQVASGTGRPLPTPRAWWTANIAASTSTVPTWSMGQGPRAALGALDAVRVAEVAPCARFVEHIIALPTPRSAYSVSRVSDRGVLVVTDDGDALLELYYVEKDGYARVEAPLGRMNEHIPFYVAFRDGAGALWLGTSIGGVWRGRLAPEGCGVTGLPCRSIEASEVGILTRSDDVSVISGPPTGAVDELFALTEEGAVERWDGEWTRLYDFAGPPEDSYRGGVAWVAPGEAVFASEREPRVWRYRDGAIADEALPQGGAPAGVSALVHAAGYGTVAGDRAGRLYASHDGRWDHLEAETATTGIRSVAAYEAGFVYVDEVGLLGQHVPGGARCPHHPRSAGTPEAPALVAVVGRDVVTAGPAVNGQLVVRWLEAE